MNDVFIWVIAILGAIFLIYVWRWRRFGAASRKMHLRHAKLVQNLSIPEAVLAHQETLTGLSFAFESGRNSSATSLHAKVEIATALYTFVMVKQGAPFGRDERRTYRMGLMVATLKNQAGGGSERRRALGKYFLPDGLPHEVKDRQNMDALVWEMKQAVPL